MGRRDRAVHGTARHHDPEHRGAGDGGRTQRHAAESEGGVDELYPEPRGVHSGQRLDGRPLRHAARVHGGGRGVHAVVGAVRTRGVGADAGCRAMPTIYCGFIREG